MHLLVYYLFLFAYYVSAKIASLFSPKAKAWVEGRKTTAARFRKFARSYNTEKKIWFHCASLGEFEQARPVMQEVRAQYPNAKIILTFFSPSGYEVRKETPEADFVGYLPFDNPVSVSEFVERMKPMLVFWVKYDFWYFALKAIHDRNIPLILFSANFRPDQVFFQPFAGKLHRKMLTFFTKIYVQNFKSQDLLRSIGVDSELAFDTRFDRVAAVAARPKTFDNILAFKGSKKLLVAGSTWKKDMELIAPLINEHRLNDWRILIAPHHVDSESIDETLAALKVKKVLLSRLHEGNANDYDVVVANMIGSLSSIYNYADAAYVGGGFGVSVHNILEPAVYGKPIMFGPNFEKSQEAIDLIAEGGASIVTNTNELEQRLSDQKFAVNARHNKDYVYAHTGGTSTILKGLSI
ncbi:MAG: glycosyltransferase N-terminal domain-containing protein [Chitinophagales bacterium]